MRSPNGDRPVTTTYTRGNDADRVRAGGLIGFLAPVFSIVAQKDRETAVVGPSIEETKQRQRRKRENE
ncbi:hypothetical protein [Halapricum desulfuricans]|uniref:hypothetical protein n=1 Tax=Halapricum desulfuricans TaxID=2841257 RepID=UPI001E30068A|nr:hypothetical protein [Halapricum desulfuricans]